MKNYVGSILVVICDLTVGTAQGLPESDERSSWQCAYPYSETNCQAILLAWSKDTQIPHQKVFEGVDCSDCEAHYHQDQYGRQHLLYAKCQNRFGARFTNQDLVAPIHKHKESVGESNGWNVVAWRFEKCFETWECGEFCSLQTMPPSCLKYQDANWGMYVTVLEGVCVYGTAEIHSEWDSTDPMDSSITTSGSTDRDNTWQPLQP